MMRRLNSAHADRYKTILERHTTVPDVHLGIHYPESIGDADAIELTFIHDDRMPATGKPVILLFFMFVMANWMFFGSERSGGTNLSQQATDSTL